MKASRRAIVEGGGGRPRSAGAVAVTAVILLTMGPEHLRQMIFEEPVLSFEIFRALSARIRRFDAQLQMIGG